MRRFLAGFPLCFALAAATLLATDRDAPSTRTITVLLQFEQPHSAQSLAGMKRELGHVLRDSGLHFQWRLLSDIKSEDQFEDLIVVKMKGQCRMTPVPALFDERGPLAYTHVSDGQVLPFSEVACDRIRVSIQSAMHGGDYQRGDELMGRALGRVLAHEVYHILAKTQGHGEHGVARDCLTARQLIADALAIEAKDLARMRR